MPEKVYQISEQLYGTLEQLQDIFDTYTLNQFNQIYYSLFDSELKEALRPYFRHRMFSHVGIDSF